MPLYSGEQSLLYRPQPGRRKARGRDSGNASDGQHADGGGAASQEDARALRDGGARREDIIDQEDVAVGYRMRLAQAEDPGDVSPARVPAELGLRAGGHGPPKRALGHGDPPPAPHLPGQERGLIESTLGFPAGMERHRDQAIHPFSGEHARSFFSQEITQGAGEGVLAAELQGVNGLPNGVAVERHRARIDEGGALPPTPLTAMGLLVARPEAPEGKTADRAERRSEPLQAVPTAATERIATPLVESAVAKRTEGWEQEIQERRDPRNPAGGPRISGRRRLGKI